MKIYSIKNEKLNFFNRPIYCESENEALTYIQNVLMSDSDRALRGLKGDLALYCLGDIDFTSGLIITGKRYPVKVCDLQEVFDSIPEDRVPKNYEALMKIINELRERVAQFEGKEGDSLDRN